APDLAFGNIRHMPEYASLPKQFQDWHRHSFCESISQWFMKGAQVSSAGLLIGNTKYTPKEGVEIGAALAAIKAILASWAPKHEHKIAACGFMLHEWFDAAPVKEKAAS